MICLFSFFVLGNLIVLSRKDKVISLESTLLSATIGAGIFSYLLVFIGYFHLLNLYTIIFCLLLISLYGAYSLFPIKYTVPNVNIFESNVTIYAKLYFVLFTLAIILTWLMCSLPEIANDALAHHLSLAKRFLQQAGAQPFFYDIKSYQSLLMNVLYTLGLAFNLVPLSKLLHWSLSLVTILSIWEYLRQKSVCLEVRLISALVFLLTPTLLNQITTTYVDGAATTFSFLGSLLVLRVLNQEKILHFTDNKSIFIAGLLLGFAVISKQSTIISCISLGVVMVAHYFLGKNPLIFLFRTKNLLIGFFLAAGFFFIRNLLMTGDPLFPMFSDLGGDDFSKTLYELGGKKNLSSFLMLPFKLTFEPELYDKHHWWGTTYLLGIPFLGFTIVKYKEYRPWGLFLLVYLLLWFFMGQNIRYFLPALPLMLVLIAKGIDTLLKSKYCLKTPWKSLIFCGSFIYLALYFALSLYHFRLPISFQLEGKQKNEYMRYAERTYDISEWVNNNLPPDSRILSLSEVRLFHFNPEVLRWGMLKKRIKNRDINTVDDVSSVVNEYGITHILAARKKSEVSAVSYDPMAMYLSTTKLVQKQVMIPSNNGREETYIYELYKVL